MTSGSFSKGAVGIYYDFASYTGDRIQSVNPGFTGATGQVLGDLTSFTGTSPGSGYFDNNAIQINHIDGLFSNNAAFLFSQKKTTSEPVTLFSNLVPVGSSGSGMEIGINATNNLYVKTFNDNTPTIFTQNIQAPAQSLRCAYFQRENVYLGTYALNSRSFEYEQFPINSYFVNNNSGASWLLGSGEYNAPLYMDFFAYCKGPISVSDLNSIGEAAYKQYYFTPDLSGVVSGSTTGTSIAVSGLTGQNEEYVLSGYDSWSTTFTSLSGSPLFSPSGGSGIVSGSTIIYQELLTGLSGLSNLYGLLPQMPTGVYRTVISSGVEATPLVTGFSGFSQSVTATFSGAVYLLSGVTGYYGSGYSYSGLTGASEPYLLSGASSGISGGPPASYNFSALTYGEERVTGESFMTYMMFGNNKPNLNKGAPLTRSVVAPGNLFNLGANYAREQLDFNINGVNSFGGDVVASVNDRGNRILRITGDYYVTGRTLLTPNLVTLADEGIFDSEEITLRSQRIITGVYFEWGGSFIWPQAHNAQIYLNGILLNSGRDYQITESLGDVYFSPLGTQLTGITGSLRAYNNYAGATLQTGVGAFAIEEQSFSKNAFVSFVNGVRQNPNNFIQYGTGVTLLGGGQIFQKTSSIPYNNTIK